MKRVVYPIIVNVFRIGFPYHRITIKRCGLNIPPLKITNIYLYFICTWYNFYDINIISI